MQTVNLGDNNVTAVVDAICIYLQDRTSIHHDNEIAVQAYQFLHNYGMDNVFEITIAMMSHATPAFRLYGAEMALRINAQNAVPLVLPLLQDPVDFVRAEICTMLQAFGNGRATEAVTNRMLSDPDGTIRYIATATLGIIGGQDALPSLQWVINHDDGTDWEGRPIAWKAAEAAEAIQRRQGA